MIVEFDNKTNDIEIFDIQSNLIVKKISRTKTTINVDVEFVNDLSDQHFVAKMLNEFFHLFNEIFNID